MKVVSLKFSAGAARRPQVAQEPRLGMTRVTRRGCVESPMSLVCRTVGRPPTKEIGLGGPR